MAKDLVKIRFEGRTLTCRPGASIAAALWENGVRVLSRSPKYGSPRGVTCARGQCTACLMRVDGLPNVRTCETPVREGMDVRRQDTGAVYGPVLQKTLTAGGPLFPVGFYYKWFTRPAILSRLFLKGIRPLTGVGRLPAADAPAGAPQAEDLGRRGAVVVGAGPSGLAAAVKAGGPVLVVDDHAQPGGQRFPALQAASHLAGGLDGFPVLAEALARTRRQVDAFSATAGAEFLPSTKAIAGYQPDGLLLRRGAGLVTLGFDRIVWAAGSLDVLGLFPGNDTPGLIGPRALYRLATRDGLDLQGSRAVVYGSGLDFWLSAVLLAARGAHVSLAVSGQGFRTEIAAAVDLKWPLHTGLDLAEVRPVGSSSLVVDLAPPHAAAGPLASRLSLEADLAVVCRPGKPAYDIPYQLGADLRLDPARGGFLPAGADGRDCDLTLPGGQGIGYRGEAAGNVRSNTPAVPESTP